MADDYTELKIRVRAWNEAGGFYPVEAEAGDGSGYDGGQLKLDRQALLPLEFNPKAYGEALFNALFAGEIRRAYDKTTARAEALTGGKLRVRLQIDDEAVELHALPWERIYHLSRGNLVPLTTSTQTPFSRYTRLETPEPEPVRERPVKILASISNPLNLPGGLAPANAEVEIDNLREALGDLRKNTEVQVTILLGRSELSAGLMSRLQIEGYQVLQEPTTLENIMRYLPGAHVWHYVGHGAFRRKDEHGPGQAVLYLEKDDGTWQATKDDEIVARLAALGQPPHLAFLVACESSMRDEKAEHPFVGLGPKLVQAGVPAVVAMQAQVPVEPARVLTGEFYRRLLEHGEVDQSLSQARLLMFKSDRTDWAIPVLFSRLRGGKLFKTQKDLEEEKKMAEEQANKQEISGDDNVVVQGSNNTTNVSKNVKQEGGVNFNVSGGSFSIGGNVVGRDMVTNTTTNITYGAGVDPNKMAALLKEFETIKKKIADLDDVEDEDKDDLKTNVQRVEDEVKKGEQADAPKVEKAIKKIAAMSDDILKVVVASLVNPAAGVAEAIRLIAQKAKSS